MFLWAVAQGSTDIRYSFDIPVEIHGVDESLVVTDQSASEVNVGVQGSRAALRNLDDKRMKYEIDVSNVKPGVAEFEVDLAGIELPRRARFVSHSPSRIQIRLERKGRKEVSVKPDIQGSPAEGFALTEVRVVPDRVWLAGARSHVMRVAEVQTEPIDVSGPAGQQGGAGPARPGERNRLAGEQGPGQGADRRGAGPGPPSAVPGRTRWSSAENRR